MSGDCDGRPTFGHRERGSGTGLTALIAVGLVAAVGLGLWLLGWSHSLRKAHDAADIAALAGAQAQAKGGDGCAVARHTAARNQARVESCRSEGSPASFVLTVTVSVPLRPTITRDAVPQRAVATAAAGNG